MSAGHRGTLRQGCSALRLLVSVAVAGCCCGLVPAAAQAGAKMSAGPDFPASVTVGQTGLTGTYTLTHTSDGAEAALLATVCNAGECAGPSEGITLVPSCGAFNNIPVCITPDPGVFAIAPTATIAPGSSCGLPPTQIFDVTTVDATTGKVLFTPRGGAHITLGPAGTPSASCQLRFTFDVKKEPTQDFRPNVAGKQTVQLGTADLSVNGLQGFGRGTSSGTTVNLPPVTPPPPVAPPPPPPPPPCVPPPGPAPPGATLCDVPIGPSSSPKGTARISGESGCVTKNFSVTVTGQQIRRVTFYLDGKKIKSLTKPNIGRLYRIAVRPKALKRGSHRIVAKTTFTTASGTPGRSLRVVFQRCARAAGAPQFTG
jgi:hypothetical protein